jgi:hypothetical protein
VTEEDEKTECPDCERGYTSDGLALLKIVQLIMIAGEDGSKGRDPHPWLKSLGIRSLSLDMAELSSALAGQPASRPGGHDGIDRWIACKKIVNAAGLPPAWGLCKTCGGSGEV